MPTPPSRSARHLPLHRGGFGGRVQGNSNFRKQKTQVFICVRTCFLASPVQGDGVICCKQQATERLAIPHQTNYVERMCCGAQMLAGVSNRRRTKLSHAVKSAPHERTFAAQSITKGRTMSCILWWVGNTHVVKVLKGVWGWGEECRSRHSSETACGFNFISKSFLPEILHKSFQNTILFTLLTRPALSSTSKIAPLARISPDATLNFVGSCVRKRWMTSSVAVPMMPPVGPVMPRSVI